MQYSTDCRRMLRTANNVARDQLLGRQILVPHAVAKAWCVQRLHAFKGLQGILGAEAPRGKRKAEGQV